MRQGETVLVVGGAGYIGSVCVAALIEQDLRVVVVDSLELGHRAAVHPGATLEECNILDGERLFQVFADNDVKAVLHFGAFSQVGESTKHPSDYFLNNVNGGLNLLEVMRGHDVKKIVFSSTAAVYGTPQSVPIDEDAPTLPINPYGRTKLTFEMMLHSFAEAHEFRYAALRYFNAAGATAVHGEDHKVETHLIPLVLQVAQGRRDEITIFGTDYDTPDGTCIRDYVHVSDLAQAHLLALDALDERCMTYNLGNGAGYSVREVIETARAVTGHPIPAREAERRAGDPSRLVASSDRIRRDLGWTPTKPDLESIIRDAWVWHEQHPQGYAS